MAVRRCQYCGAHIEWLLTRFGSRLPFDHKPVPVEQVDDADSGWVPGRWTVKRQERHALAPLSHYNAHKRAAVRWVVLVHSCAGYREHAARIEKESVRGTEVR